MLLLLLARPSLAAVLLLVRHEDMDKLSGSLNSTDFISSSVVSSLSSLVGLSSFSRSEKSVSGLVLNLWSA